MTTAILPCVDTEYVELTSTPVSRLVRKQILPMNGSFVHPKIKTQKILVDQQFAETLVKNFHDGVCSTVQFPMVNDQNQHVEGPDRNLGEVVDLTYDDSGVYATIDVRKHPEDIGKTILGASAMMSLDYEDSATGTKVGPTLLHVAATNRPYLTQLKPYETVALSASDTDDECVVFSASDDPELEEDPMTREELLAALKDEHGIDVEALQAEVEEAQAQIAASAGDSNEELVAALSGVLAAANPNMVALSAEDIGIEEVAQGVVELSRDFVATKAANSDLVSRVETLEAAHAEKRVEEDLRAGKFLPVQKDAMLELLLSNAEMYDRLIPDSSIVSLTEEGVTVHEQPGNEALAAAEEQVKHYLEMTKD
jgi:hypothetical protein